MAVTKFKIDLINGFFVKKNTVTYAYKVQFIKKDIGYFN